MKIWSSVAALFAIVSLGAQIAVAQNGYDLFQKGLVRERAEGNLQEAIELYKRVVAESTEDRPLVAKALVQIGACYEKLGKSEARKAYEQVINDYADQKTQLAEAKSRLSALGQSSLATGFTVRPVWTDVIDTEGGPSPNRRYFSYVDWGTGDLAVHDLLTGDNRRITNTGGWTKSGEYAQYSVFSPNGQQIAYAWFSDTTYRYELRVIGLDGSEPRTLYATEQVGYLEPHAWSRDGKSILVACNRTDGTNEIVLVSTTEDSARTVKSLDWRAPVAMDISPDGRYIVYDLPPDKDSPNRDLFLVSTDGSHEIAIVEHASNDLGARWTPDGERVIFTSDRTGTSDIWILTVADGKPRGNPKLLKQDMGRAWVKGFARDDALYYAVNKGLVDVYVATMDATTGELLDPPTPASSRYVGSNYNPFWSPDGLFLAFVSHRSEMGNGSTLCILSAETGEQRELSLRGRLAAFGRRGMAWSFDGTSILAGGSDVEGRLGIFEVDVQTGGVEPFLMGGWGVIHIPTQSSPDGKLVYYVRWSDSESSVVRREVATGNDENVFSTKSRIWATQLSPNGRQLALSIRESFGEEGETRSVRVIPSAGGTGRELCRLPVAPPMQGEFAWAPDGRHLLMLGQIEGRRDDAELWWVSADGGEPEKLGVTMPQMRHLSVTGDGEKMRVAFQAGERFNSEIWVMENFLPPTD